MTAGWPTVRAVVVAACAAIGLAGAAEVQSGLSEGRRLGAIYDTILDARFDAAARELETACPPAPEEACAVLATVSLWWQILLDPRSRSRDAAFRDAVEAGISLADAWTEREPDRAEAWFYRAAARAPLVQWRALRGERLAAAREANRIRSLLERSLSLDPALDDALFGIGLYHYYADTLPAAARIFRWLLLLPGGDREQGLQEMLRARAQGELLRGEADYQLHWIYLRYERQPERALALLADLDRRHPTNPIFLQRIAEVHGGARGDHPASAAAWRMLLARAEEGRVAAAALTAVGARLGLAQELEAMFETDRAIEQLERVVALAPAAPYGAHALAELQLGAASDRIGRRDTALAHYAAAAALAPPGDPDDIGRQARSASRRAPDQRRARAYGRSLAGLRALERGAHDEAVAALGEAVETLRTDQVARYRFARALLAAGRTAEARAELERVVAARPPAPPIARASALVDLAALIERAGAPDRARDLFQRAVDVVGGAPEARDAARRALARLAP